MSVIHFTLLGKGGVGKTTVATRLAQYYMSHGFTTHNYDTDPVNQSFKGYKALKVKPLPIVKSEEMDFTAIEKLIKEILESKDQIYIIDNGSTSYLTVLKYLMEGGIVDILHESGHQVVFHPIMAAGEGFAPSINGLKALFEQFEHVTKIIWLNEYHGAIEVNGQEFKDSPLYHEYQEQIHALIKLPKYNQSLFGEPLNEMAFEKLTFQEVRNGSQFHVLVRSRLMKVWNEFTAMADEAQLLILPGTPEIPEEQRPPD